MANYLRNTAITVIAAAALQCVAPGPSLRAQIVDGEPGLEAAKSLVVMIDGKFNETTQGAGVVFALSNGYAYIATMFHVVRQANPDGGEDRLASDLKVRFYSDPSTNVQAFHVTAGGGLAVIRVKTGVTELFPTGVRPSLVLPQFKFDRLGDPGAMRNGFQVYAIGQAGKDWAVTYQAGSVSNVDSAWIEVQSAYILHGDSGGALIDREGRILGLVEDTDGTTAKAMRIDRALDTLRLDFKLPVQLTAAGASGVQFPNRLPAPGEARVNPKDRLTYRWVPPGKFRMGCSEQPKDPKCDRQTEFPVHDVTIRKGFWMGETEVTEAAWERFAGLVPSSRGPMRPAEWIAWDDASAFCASSGMRLPTEAEWEYAARAGTRASTYGEPGQIAWYLSNSGGNTHDVGLKFGNAWNLRDMLGNVAEWTADWFDPGYYKNASASVDPKGPVKPTKSHVVRGGSALDLDRVRVSAREGLEDPNKITIHLDDSKDFVSQFLVGFRCAGELN